MPNTRTLADIWSSLGIDERIVIFVDRYHLETPQGPSTLRSAGYADCVADVEHFVLGSRPLPGEDAN